MFDISVQFDPQTTTHRDPISQSLKSHAQVVGAVRFGGCGGSIGIRRLGMSLPPCPERAPATMIPYSSKRRRLAPQGGESWASLHEDLVQLIGWRVLAGDLLDYVRFRAVCCHWNSSTVGPRGRGLVDPRFHPRRWMMLPEGHGLYPGHPNLGGYVRFFNLSTGSFVRVHLPLFDDHIVLDSTDGLLLLYRDHDTAIRLLHPFTGDVAEFPPMLSLPPQLEPHKRYPSIIAEDSMRRELRVFLGGVCAAVSVSAAGAISVMLGLDIRYRVAYATAGDQRWSLSAWKLTSLLTLTVSFQGKLYASAVNSADNNNIYICQIDPPQPNTKGLPSSPLPPPRMIVKCPLVGKTATVNLVECGSELMLVGSNNISRANPVVYRLTDLISGRVVPITNIGEHALFIAERGLSVTPNKRFPSVLCNTIICKNRSPPPVESCDLWQRFRFRPRVEQFDLGSGTWSAIDGDILHRDRTPASPYTLSHHIFTCCYRCYWNKGLMLCAAIIPDWSVKPNLQ